MAGESQDALLTHSRTGVDVSFKWNSLINLFPFMANTPNSICANDFFFPCRPAQVSDCKFKPSVSLQICTCTRTLAHKRWFEPSCCLMITGVPTDDLRLPAEHLLHRRQRILRAILLLWHARWVGSVKPIKIFVFLSRSVVVNEAWIWCFFYCLVSVWNFELQFALWNSLPSDIRNTHSDVAQFKSKPFCSNIFVCIF